MGLIRHVIFTAAALLLASFPTWAEAANLKACVVISGVDQDEEGSFGSAQLVHPSWLRKGRTIAGVFCEIKNSWVDATDYIFELKAHGKIARNDEILVVQETHGGKGGSAFCNAGIQHVKEIFNFLNGFAFEFSVTAILDGCFTGDLLKLKLKEDLASFREGEISSAIHRLCILTESGFGRISRSDEDLGNLALDVRSGQSAEQVFLNSTSGLISSAPWDTVGVSDYLVNSVNHRDSSNILQRMASFIQRGSKKSPNLLTVLALVSESLNHEVLTYLGQYAKSQFISGEDYRILLGRLQAVTEAENVGVGILSDKANWGKDCARSFEEILLDHEPFFDSTLVFTDIVSQKLIQFSRTPEFAACREYYQARKRRDRVRNYALAEDQMWEIFAEFTGNNDFHDFQDAKNFLEIYVPLRSHFPSANYLDPVSVLTALRRLTPRERVLSLQTNSIHLTQEHSLESALGNEAFFRPGECTRDGFGNNPNSCDSKFSPGLLTQAFAHSDYHPSHEATLDRLRREACQNFIF